MGIVGNLNIKAEGNWITSANISSAGDNVTSSVFIHPFFC